MTTNPYLSASAVEIVNHINRYCKRIQEDSTTLQLLAQAVQLRFSFESVSNLPGLPPQAREMLRMMMQPGMGGNGVEPFAQTPSYAGPSQYDSQTIPTQRRLGAGKRPYKKSTRKFTRATQQNSAASHQPLLESSIESQPQAGELNISGTAILPPPSVETASRRIEPSSTPAALKKSFNEQVSVGHYHRLMIAFAKKHGGRLDVSAFAEMYKDDRVNVPSKWFVKTTIYTYCGDMEKHGNLQEISNKPRVYRLVSDDLSWAGGTIRRAAAKAS